MKHEQRLRLARKLTELMVRKYGSDIVLSGVYGSTSRGTDTEYSDLEMFFVVKDESKAKSISFAYKRMPIEIAVQKIREVEKDITEIELDWPLKMGRLFNLKLTDGDEAVLKRFREILQSIPRSRINQFIAKHAPLCYEGLGRLKAGKVRHNTAKQGCLCLKFC